LKAGRFNRPGLPALYSSLEPQTALAEYHRADEPRPCVFVAIRIEAFRIIDLTTPVAGVGRDWDDWKRDDWEATRDDFEAGNMSADCAGWRCGDAAVKGNCTGILFPSRFMVGGRNLVLFTDDYVVGSLIIDPIDPAREIMSANPITL
jgi:RES domain-containing protein